MKWINGSWVHRTQNFGFETISDRFALTQIYEFLDQSEISVHGNQQAHALCIRVQ